MFSISFISKYLVGSWYQVGLEVGRYFDIRQSMASGKCDSTDIVLRFEDLRLKSILVEKELVYIYWIKVVYRSQLVWIEFDCQNGSI